MADEGRQPVAIRIARPYASEEAFLEHELDTLTRTSVILVGAQARPQGVVLRFEITLASGAPLLRGEGRVVAFKPDAHGGEPGLTLRFTRLDPRSKALVDRAAALRDARARRGMPTSAFVEGGSSRPPAPPSAPPEPMAMPVPSPQPSPVSVSARRSAPPPPLPSRPPGMPSRPPPLPISYMPEPDPPPPEPPSARELESIDRLLAAHPVPLAMESADDIAAVPPPPPPPAIILTPAPARPVAAKPASIAPTPYRGKPSTPPNGTTGGEKSKVARPADRDALLERLRTRSRSLPEARVSEILGTRR